MNNLMRWRDEHGFTQKEIPNNNLYQDLTLPANFATTPGALQQWRDAHNFTDELPPEGMMLRVPENILHDPEMLKQWQEAHGVTQFFK